MYAGAGSAPMTAAASAWDRLAAELSSAAGSYQAVVSQLTDESWRGPTSASMAAAAAPYAKWMHSTAARAVQTANQARAAVASYRAAFAATVPPPVIAANRSQLASLAATNTFGQNSQAIAAKQAEYGEMWAQDVAAMHTYAASSAAAASALTPYNAPPQTTDPAGGAQAAAAQSSPGPLTQLAQAIVSNKTIDALNRFLEMVNSPNFVVGAGLIQEELQYMLLWPAYSGAATAAKGYAGSLGLIPVATASSVSEGASQVTLAGSSGPGVGAPGSPGLAGAGGSAGLARATPVGGLSVPPSWGTRLAGIRLAAAAVPVSGSAGLVAVQAAGMTGTPGGWLGGIPPVASVVNTSTGGEPRARPSSDFTVIPRLAREVAAAETAQYRGPPHRSAPAAANTPAQHENPELAELRRTVAELAKDCELLESSADTLLREAGVLPASARRYR